MKKKILITSVSLLIGGFLCAVVGLAIAGFDFTKLGNPLETNTHTITEDFNNIAIDVDTANVRFAKSSDDSCTVVCAERVNAKHSVSVQDGTLRITVPEMKWYGYIGLNSGKESVTLYLPQTTFNSLVVETDTSDVDMPTGFLYQRAVVETDTGDIRWKATVTDSLSLTVDTGDVEVKGAGITTLRVESDTGDVELAGLLCQNVFVETESGDVEVSSVQCANVSLKTDTGEVDCQGLIALAKISVETDTGDVELDGCDADSLKIITDTGDVRGRLLTDKHYIARSDTGDIQVPDTVGGKCEIITDTGDIYFR